MIPSRGLARVSPGLAFQTQILSRTPARSIPRQAISRPSVSSPRQFGTSLRSHGAPLPRTSMIASLSGRRAGAAGILSAQTILLSNRRFASTDSTTHPDSTAPTTASEFSPETVFSSLSDVDSASILNVPEQVGYLANLGLDYGWGPTSVCQWVLEHLHFDFGLPWWGAVFGFTVVTRLALLYPSIYAQHMATKSQDLNRDPVYAAANEKFMAAMMGGTMANNELLQLRMQMKYQKEQAGVKAWPMMLPMLQVPFAFGMFKLGRAMALLPVPGLETAGTLWFTDLTVADPLYILPCVSTVLMHLTFKSGALSMTGQAASMMKYMPWIIGPVTILVTMNMPAVVQFYLAAASLLQYVQTALFRTPSVRTILGLPPLTPVHEAATPSSANRQGAYQAPRTIRTTAVVKERKSPLQMFRDAREGMNATATEFMDKSKKGTPEDQARAQEKARRAAELAQYRSRVAGKQKRAGKK